MPRVSLKQPAAFLCVNIGILDNTKLKRYLPSWTPTSLKAAIAKTTDWYLDAENAFYTLKLSADEDEH